MAVKAGQVIHDAYGFVIDRIQTGGASGLNIPEEKIYEVGNFQAVATVRDSPDLSFGLETFDASTELEALLTFSDPTTTTPGQMFDFGDAVPMDIISPLKDGWNIYSAAHGIVIPYLTLESASYKFEMKGSATQTHSLKGDSYFFTDGSPYYEEYAGDGASTTFTVSNGPALPYFSNGKNYYMLGISVHLPDGTCRRLFLDDNYTNTAAGFTLTDPTIAPTGSTIRVVYASATVVTYPQSVHADTTVKPAAVRGRSIDVYVGNEASATPIFSRWTSVQSAEINWSVTLDKDEEFGNSQYVSQDHDVPEVSGNVVIRPRDVRELFERIQQVSNTAAGGVSGPLTSEPLPMEIRMYEPDSGVLIKTLYVEDARFKVPNVESRVQEKANLTFEWTSDGGNLKVIEGARIP